MFHPRRIKTSGIHDEVVNPGLFPFPQSQRCVRALEVDEAIGVDHGFS